MGDIGKRKRDHLALCATDKVAFRDQTNLLECVTLMHQSLPELSLDELDLSVTMFGKTLKAPIFIAAMTGGTDTAAEINHTLSAIAEKRGYGFGLGSQRAMQRTPETTWTYAVREHAPTAILLGNVGVVQARDFPTEVIAKLVSDVGADALCVHLNPAMEIVQPDEGDIDFRGCVDTLTRLANELPVPVVAKETGSGISRRCAGQIKSAGVEYVDVSGAGGTSWVGVEALRARGEKRQLGEALWDWGVPTAAAVHYCREIGLNSIATGGVKTGLDIARAIALGASAAGIARPVLQALKTGGAEAAEAYLAGVERELVAIMLLTGSKTINDLKAAPKLLRGDLRDWL